MDEQRQKGPERETSSEEVEEAAKIADNPPLDGDGEKGLGTKTGGIEGGEPTEP